VTEIALACGINTDPERDEMPNLDCHALRHVFASAVIKATRGDIAKVATMTGHKDTEVLHRISLHEFQSARGEYQAAQDIADFDAAFGG
jgi:hypothetical protein